MTLFRLHDGNQFIPEEHNLYFLFGVTHSASTQVIKCAYRKLVLKYHPDRHAGDNRFELAFRHINSIYGILSDFWKRKDYDIIYNRRILQMLWQYKKEDFNPNSFDIIPEGKYRVRIEKAEEQISRSSGKPMIKLTLAVSGYNSLLWAFQVLDDSDREHEKMTNQRLGTIFNSFSIPEGNMNIEDWVGKSGGAFIKHQKDAQGKERAGIGYFLFRNEVDKLPAWQDKQPAPINPDMMDFSGNNSNPYDIPF